MKLTSTPLSGAYLIDLEKREDARGFFARTFCEREFDQWGLETRFVQMNSSLSTRSGTLRGLHFQTSPMAEVKVVRCIRGSVWDCILDLREESATFGRWFGHLLSTENRTMMYVPKGFAHGFFTLEPESEVFYLVSAFYSASHERGVRWNDPAFTIEWPGQPVEISDRDRHHPDFSREMLR